MPRGKTLFLGPAGRGQVNDDTLERPAFKKMVEAGEIEVLLEDGSGPTTGGGTSGRVQRSAQGHAGSHNVSRKGDR